MSLIIEWDEERNAVLKENRKVCFEDVENSILDGSVIDIIPHHNPGKYPNQELLIIRIENYIYYVPFVIEAKKMFLKNIIPSQKYNTKY